MTVTALLVVPEADVDLYRLYASTVKFPGYHLLGSGQMHFPHPFSDLGSRPPREDWSDHLRQETAAFASHRMAGMEAMAPGRP